MRHRDGFSSILAGLLPCAALVMALGCSASSDGDDASEGLGGSPGSEESVVLRFEPQATLTLAPTEVSRLQVRVTPPRRQTIVFEILSEETRFDGFLFGNSVQSSSDGLAEVSLQGPSTPSTFQVRASTQGAGEARLSVSVSSLGYGTIVVQPRYRGKRTITRWTASARAGTTCEDLDSLLSDGPLVASDGKEPRVELVPVGPPIAVSLRGNGLATGCVNVPDVEPDEELSLSVEVGDVPLNLKEGTLEARFSVSSTTADWADQVGRSLDEANARLLGSAADDRAALLDWMAAALDPDDATNFETNRASGSYEDLAAAAFAADAIRRLVRERLLASAELFADANALVGTWEFAGTKANFQLDQVVQADPRAAGFVAESSWQLELESGDTLNLGGTLHYRPLVALWAITDANAASEGKLPAPELLADAVDCNRLALDMTSASSGSVYDGCGVACTVDLCREALEHAWNDLAGSERDASIQLAVGAKAFVNEEPVVSALEGTWVGRLRDDKLTDGRTALQGDVSAERR